MGKCPTCKNEISNVKVENIGKSGFSGGSKIVAYLCPSCNTILGVETAKTDQR